MKNKSALNILIGLIAVLALVAVGFGLFYETPGDSYPLTTIRGEEVIINGHGLYAYDTVSSTAQQQANDFITLILGLPLLIISTILANRGSLRARLLLAGTLGFFLYTYMSMSVGTAFNFLFLVYVALFGLSLYALVLTMLTFDLKTLPAQFSDRLPRSWIAGVLFAGGALLTFAWIGGRILPTLMNNTVPALENTTTMFIQAMDLVLIAPLAFISGALLLKRSAWGYLLASVAVMKFLTMGIAVSSMGINMALRGVPEDPVFMGIFILLSLINILMAVLLLKNVREPSKQLEGRKA